MSADSIAISRDLVKAGLEQKIADAIAQKIVAHSGGSAETKAELARVEAGAKAERETKSDRLERIEDRLDKMDARMDRMEGRIDKIISDVSDMKASFKWITGLLIPMCAGIVVLVIEKIS